MKLFLDIEEVKKSPRRWAALLAAGGLPAGSARGSELAIVLNYLARNVTSVRKVICQRRRSMRDHGRERFVLRPAASAEPGGAAAVWVGLVCEYDAALRALRVVDRVAVQPSAVLPFERVFHGDIALESRPLAPAYCDGDAVAFLNRLPVAAEAEPAPTDRWRAYLDWRRKLAETKAAESHVYVAWEKRGGRVARFFLRDGSGLAGGAGGAVDKLRQRLQDEELRAGADARDARSPQGVFRRVAVVLGAGGQGGARRVAVDLEFDALTWDGLRLPPQGELRVAMEGELASLEIQTNGLRRFAEKQAQNPRLPEWLFAVGRAQEIGGTAAVTWTPELTLNPEQREAVARALAMDDLLLLWGPPGTGKTTVIAEICAQYARRGRRVLVASQANLAVEQALGRLPRLASVRPAWVSTARKRDGATAGDVAGGMRRWLGAVGAAARAERPTSNFEDPTSNSEHPTSNSELPTSNGEHLASNAEHSILNAGDGRWAGYLREWAARLENLSEDDVSSEDEARYLRRANVIGATCNETGKPDFIASPRFDARFDLVVVDEVSKATPPELLLAMLMGRRVLLVGDHRQLPPMFRDEPFEDAIENGEIAREEVDAFKGLVTASLFDGYFRAAAPSVRVGLRRQYRMHPRIMEAVNGFYADQPLLPGDGAEALMREKRHALKLGAWLNPGRALVWIDTALDQTGWAVRDERVGASRRNALEAELAAKILGELASAPEAAGMSVAVISFYRAQVELLRDRWRRENAPAGWLHPGRDINTVDQFQGSERDVVIVSLVRNDARLTGEFARDFRRINVAFSRARKLLIVLGSRGTFAGADVVVPTAEGGDAAAKVYARIQALARREGGFFPAADILGTEVAS